MLARLRSRRFVVFVFSRGGRSLLAAARSETRFGAVARAFGGSARVRAESRVYPDSARALFAEAGGGREQSASSELRQRECSGETMPRIGLIALDRCRPGSSSLRNGSPVRSGHGRQRSSAAASIRSLDIDDGLSDAAESPRSDACINWPNRRRRRRSRPAPTSVLVRMALGTIAASLAYAGHSKFKRSDLYGVADRSKWRTCAGYDARDFAAVAAATVGFPAAWFCFAGAGSAAADRFTAPINDARRRRWLRAHSALAYRTRPASYGAACSGATPQYRRRSVELRHHRRPHALDRRFSAFLLFAGLALRVARRRSTPSTTLTEPLLDEAEAGPPEPLPCKSAQHHSVDGLTDSCIGFTIAPHVHITKLRGRALLQRASPNTDGRAPARWSTSGRAPRPKGAVHGSVPASSRSIQT